jgi:hypothetical protein
MRPTLTIGDMFDVVLFFYYSSNESLGPVGRCVHGYQPVSMRGRHLRA